MNITAKYLIFFILFSVSTAFALFYVNEVGLDKENTYSFTSLYLISILSSLSVAIGLPEFLKIK